MKIFFARHGESQANLLHMISNRDLPHRLTSKGHEQAHSLADSLTNSRITHIFTSPIPRAMETGSIVASRLGLECIVTGALREYDCGIYEGRSDEAAWQAWQRLFDAWYLHQRYDECLDMGETFYHMLERFMGFIHDLVTRFANTDTAILCISHGGIYCQMLPLAVSNITHDLIAKYGFDYTACIMVELLESGLSCVEWNGHPVEMGFHFN